MENLLLLLKKASSLLLFLFLELIAILLIVFNNNYQHSVFSRSMTAVNGNISDITGSISKYFYLTENNEELLKENALLREELLAVKAQLNIPTDSLQRNYKVITANIINNSVNNPQNLIMLDKGELDGIKPDMGVICATGVVGIVKTVSDNFSVVIPIVNNQSKISCKLDSSNNFGSLIWENVDYRYAKLSEIPKHVKVSIGEKISTSGFSSIFPANIPVGEVIDVKEESEQFLSIDVKLSTNFRTLSYVEVMDFCHKQELDSISVAQ
jgi:rod shape-determining protein MreC